MLRYLSRGYEFKLLIHTLLKRVVYRTLRKPMVVAAPAGSTVGVL